MLPDLLPELDQLEGLIEKASPTLRSEVLTTVNYHDISLPIHACFLGSEAKDAPVLVFTGGVHGVERIGSQVVLAFMETLVQRLQWDDSLISGLHNLRLLFIPIVNPVGVILQTRANGASVDLMRNAPVEAENRVPLFVGGHRLTGMLPWYRGKKKSGMEPESTALCEAINRQLEHSPFTLSLDVHSGYGFFDRLWFPLASSYKPIEQLPEIYALYDLLETTYPNVNYVFEPQSKQYLAHGDLWDYLYLQHSNKDQIFLPLTLEMGSWNWVKKNPMQLLSAVGLFHPVKPHRTQRVLRRHTILLEFLVRAARAYTQWIPAQGVDNERREQLRQIALKLWY